MDTSEQKSSLPKLIYITSTHCQVCKSLKPKIKQMLVEHFPKMELIEYNTLESPEITAQWSVFAVPTILIFFDDHELFRYSRHLSIQQLISDLSRPYKMYFEEI